MEELKKPITSNIVPAEKIVVLTPVSPANVTHGSIEVVSDKMPELGRVIAIGKAKKPCKIKIGDTIAYRRYGESKFFIGGQEIIFVGFQDILGVIPI